MKAAEAKNIRRIVVRGANWVGDAVMTVPALRALRGLFPQAHIALASRSGTADIFIDADFVDEVLIFERSGPGAVWHQSREWRRRRVDLAVLFQNAFAAAAVAFLARVPMRAGYAADHRSLLLTHPIALPSWKDERHESFYYLNIIAELEKLLQGTSSIKMAEPQFDLDVSAERREQAWQLLRKQGARVGAPIVLLCPGSINSRAKRWPAENYAALGDRFIEQGANVVLIGSAAEIDVSHQVCANMRQQPIVLTGKTTVAEVTAAIGIADVLVTNDTGPAHIGSAVKAPTLVIFGPTNPRTTYPFSATAEMIRHPPDCAPCMLRDCPIDHRCLTAITPAEVFERARALMRAREHASVIV